MSVPRLRRTVALTPSVAEVVGGTPRTRSGGVPRVGQPGVGLRGMRFTWARQRAGDAGQLVGVGAPGR